MAGKRADASNSAPRRPVAKTPEGREAQLQSLAYDLVEKRLLEGTASATETTYLLKSADSRTKLELARIENQNLLDQARIEQIKSSQGQEVLLEKAMKAFTQYSGKDAEEDDDFPG